MPGMTPVYLEPIGATSRCCLDARFANNGSQSDSPCRCQHAPPLRVTVAVLSASEIAVSVVATITSVLVCTRQLSQVVVAHVSAAKACGCGGDGGNGSQPVAAAAVMAAAAAATMAAMVLVPICSTLAAAPTATEYPGAVTAKSAAAGAAAGAAAAAYFAPGAIVADAALSSPSHPSGAW
eukprot:3231032-Pleurochrysis_carterae.AAC.1